MATADFRYRVRSNQEAQIANFLFLNRVEYFYEPDYESPTATFERRQYRPDFYLPAELYLEHFAVSHPSQTCPDFIPRRLSRGGRVEAGPPPSARDSNDRDLLRRRQWP